VKGRLERARTRLRKRLALRGLTAPALLGGLIGGMPSALAETTLAAVRGGELSPAVAKLVAGVTRMDPTFRFKPIFALVAVAGGLAVLGAFGSDNSPGPEPQAATAPPEPTKLVVWSVPMREGQRLDELFLTARAGVWTPDGRHVLTTGLHREGKPHERSVNEVRVWDAATGKLIHTFRNGVYWFGFGPWSGSYLAISPDGKTVAAAGTRIKGSFISPVVEVWDWGQEKPRLTLDGFRQEVHAVAFAPDGKTLIAADHQGGVLAAWDPASGKKLYQVQRTGWPWAIAFHPAGAVYATANHAEGVRFVDTATGTTRGTYRPPGLVGGVRSVAFSPDGKSVAVVPVQAADEDIPQIVVFDVTVPATGNMAAANPRSIPRTAGRASYVAFSPDGKYLTAAYWDGSIQVYDPATGRRVAGVREHTNSVLAVQFSPNGKWLLSVGRDAIKMWSVAELLKRKPK
jgi:WD40 repeat protein